MGPSTADVRHRYAEAGLVMPKNFTDLPDHIAVEMEFMHFLCAEELKDIGQGNSEESTRRRRWNKNFLRNTLNHGLKGLQIAFLSRQTHPSTGRQQNY